MEFELAFYVFALLLFVLWSCGTVGLQLERLFKCLVFKFENTAELLSDS